MKKTNIELTEREAEAIKLLKKGLSNRKIGDKMDLAEGSVKNLLTKIYKKYHVETRSQLLALILS